jgi:hypothetical protein
MSCLTVRVSIAFNINLLERPPISAEERKEKMLLVVEALRLNKFFMKSGEGGYETIAVSPQTHRKS